MSIKNNLPGDVAQNPIQNLVSSSKATGVNPNAITEASSEVNQLANKNVPSKYRSALKDEAEAIANYYQDAEFFASKEVKNEQVILSNAKRMESIYKSDVRLHEAKLRSLQKQGLQGTANYKAEEANFIMAEKALKNERNLQFETKKKLNVLDNSSNMRRNAFMEAKQAIQHASKAAQELEEKHERIKRSPAYAMLRGGPRAFAKAGKDQMLSNMADMATDSGGSFGGMAGGALALVGGVIISKALEKGFDVLKRSLKANIDVGDAFKTAALAGENSEKFRRDTRFGQIGLGTTIEEQAHMTSMLRPYVGRIGSESFSEVMRQGVGLDRAFGSQTGTGTQFFGEMIRKSGITDNHMKVDTQSLNRLSGTVAEAIGRGRLVGLQEEMLKGIQQLVDIGRLSSVAGVNPGLFANMIADLSMTGGKNMRGVDAANMIAGMDASMKNPQGPWPQFMAQNAIDKVLNGLYKDQKIQRNPNTVDAAERLFMQKQGMAMEIEDIGGKRMQIGDLVMKTIIQENAKLTGNKYFGALAAESLGIKPAQYLNAISADKGIEANHLDELYGIDAKNLHHTPVVDSFLMNLSEQASTFARGRKPGDISDKEKHSWLMGAVDTLQNGLTTDDEKREFNQMRKQVQGTSDDKQAFEMAVQFAEKHQDTSPEEGTRKLMATIDAHVAELAEHLIPAVEGMASTIVNWVGSSDMQKNFNDKEIAAAIATRKRETPEWLAEQAKKQVEESRLRDMEHEVSPRDVVKFFRAQQRELRSDPKIQKIYADAVAAAGNDPTKLKELRLRESQGQFSNEFLEYAKTNAGPGGRHATQGERLENYRFAAGEADRQHVPQDLVKAIIDQESHGDTYGWGKLTPYGHAGGVMQLTPGTAKALGVTDVFNPQQNIKGGVKLLRDLLNKYKGDESLAIRGYFGGDERNWGKDTANYGRDVLARLAEARGTAQAPPLTTGQNAALAANPRPQAFDLNHTTTLRVENGSTGAVLSSPQTFTSQLSPDKPSRTSYPINMTTLQSPYNR